MTTSGHDADIRRSVNDCLELNGLPGGPCDLDMLTALWPLMRNLAETLYDIPLPAWTVVGPASCRSRPAP